KHPAALNGMGQLALTRGKTDDAEKWFLKCGETAPAAWYGLARLYLAQEKFEDAEKWVQKIIDGKQTGGQDEYVQRMLAAAKAKHLDDDMKAQLAPLLGSPVAQDIQRAFRLLQKGQRDEAREIFEKALEEHPDDPNVLNGVGWFRVNTGEVPAAQQMFEKCLEIQPADIGAMNGLANCFKQQGRVDEAIELWKQMLEKYPSANSMGWILAETYMERNEFEKALPIWEKLAKEQPENEAVKAGLAKAREGAKK
ncbi:MAG: tetratricopeptide repeat protein, partial [Anaerolineae bacterium]|nr:tetratricopeptide repeat protein [Phycisphaerae bacterium]